ncbi:unnamed protein product [Amoebophrya sp. A25]|nr:unnamed protein product [Amoebophrya sp. A25]|eukprot:GSA25T00001721001.1
MGFTRTANRSTKNSKNNRSNGWQLAIRVMKCLRWEEICTFRYN